MIRLGDMTSEFHAWWRGLKAGDTLTHEGVTKTIATLPVSTNPYPVALFEDGSYAYVDEVEEAPRVADPA